MQSSDLRIRRLSSRYQVSAAGAHLIDGIAYGRSYLKRPDRPPVRIPSLKRRRLLYDPQDENLIGPSPEREAERSRRQLRITSSFDDADIEYDDGVSAAVDTIEGEDENTASARRLPGILRSGKWRKTSAVHFEAAGHSLSEDDEDSEEEDYEPSDLGASENDTDADHRQPQARPQGRRRLHRASTSVSSGSDTSSDSEEISDSDLDDLSDSSSDVSSDSSLQPPESEDNRPPESQINDDVESRTLSTHVPEKDQAELPVPEPQRPGDGLSRTKARNQRRKDAKRRKKLAEEEAAHAVGSSELMNETGPQHHHFGGQTIEAEITAESASGLAIEDADHLQKSIQSAVREAITVDTPLNAEDNAQGATNPMNAQTSGAPRSKLDVASTRRLLFGSLGVRNPKSKADEAKVQEQLRKTSHKAGKGPAIEEPAGAASTHDELTGDAWKEKIVLSAVECCDEGVTLSTPPYPFVQRWDPQQKRGKKRKRQPAIQEYWNEQNYDNDGLNYGDGLDYDEAATYDGAAEADATPDGVSNSQAEQDDLPPVPDDIEALPPLTLEDCQPGTIIIFKRLEVSQETGWQPGLSELRTAVINDCDDASYLSLTLAARDVFHREPQYDRAGNRVYDRFEVPQDSEDEEELEDPALIIVAFDDLVNPKILRAVSPSESVTVVTEVANQSESQTNLVPDSVNATHYLAKEEIARQAKKMQTAGTHEDDSQAASVSSASVALDQAAQLPISLHSSGFEGSGHDGTVQGVEVSLEPSLLCGGSQIEASAG